MTFLLLLLDVLASFDHGTGGFLFCGSGWLWALVLEPTWFVSSCRGSSVRRYSFCFYSSGIVWWME